eukprot:1454321-Amphidinium_carterae.1
MLKPYDREHSFERLFKNGMLHVVMLLDWLTSYFQPPYTCCAVQLKHMIACPKMAYCFQSLKQEETG